jgi:enoyl-[acyl-carrier protein] reductase I
MLKLYAGISPMRRNITADEVGRTSMALLSNLASGITGEILHVDCGFSIMGAPPADFFTAVGEGS